MKDSELSWPHLVALAFLVITVVWLGSLGKRKIPGPNMPWHHITFIPPFLQAAGSGQLHSFFFSLSRQYGRFLKFNVLGASGYIINDAELVQQVFDQPKLFPSRGNNGIKYFIPQSLLGFEDNCPSWKRHRSILSNLFTDRCLKSYSSEIASVGQDLVRRLQINPIVPDVSSMFADLTYTVLCCTVLGKPFLESSGASLDKEGNAALLSTAAMLTFLPAPLWNIFPIPGRALAQTKFNQLRENLQTELSHIRSTGAAGESMLHRLASHGGGDGLSDGEILDEMMSMIMAGHETTANTLSFACVCLALHPKIQEEARAEIRQYTDCNGRISYSDIQSMKFLWAVFRETLRMYPTVPFTFRVPTADTMLGDRSISKGDRVFINAMSMCYDERAFPEPFQFQPSRWLSAGADGTNIATLKNHDLTRNFGGGLRVCIGKRFAEEESIVILATILASFVVKVESIGEKSGKELDSLALSDIGTTSNVTLTLRDRVAVSFNPATTN